VLARTPSNTAGVEGHRQDRYEPLPGFADLPGWAWRRIGRRGRIAAGMLLVAAIAVTVALASGIREAKRENAESERRERARLEARRLRELRAEQRPRFGRLDAVAPTGAPAARRLEARAELMEGLAAAIVADARRRVRRGRLDGPILRTDCEPFPRTVEGIGAERDLSRRRGRYSCVAVTADIPRSEASLGGVIGHQYRVLVDFETGRYAFCKVLGRADAPPDPRVTTPQVCGGT
jgi:hypothetical protein